MTLTDEAARSPHLAHAVPRVFELRKYASTPVPPPPSVAIAVATALQEQFSDLSTVCLKLGPYWGSVIFRVSLNSPGAIGGTVHLCATSHFLEAYYLSDYDWRVPDGFTCTMDLRLNGKSKATPKAYRAPGQLIDLSWATRLLSRHLPVITAIDFANTSLDSRSIDDVLAQSTFTHHPDGMRITIAKRKSFDLDHFTRLATNLGDRARGIVPGSV